MQIKRYTLFIILLVVMASCKKKSNAHYQMTMRHNNDSATTTTTVTAAYRSSYLTISGYNPQTDEVLTLYINAFNTTSAHQTFTIIPGGSSSSAFTNRATYTSVTSYIDATSGQIFITNLTGDYIIGSFDFFGNGHVTGTFQAPRP